jgi:hypothetical protein
MVLRRSIAFGMVMSPPCFYLLSTPAVSSQHTTHNTQHAMHSTAQHIVAQCKTQRSAAQHSTAQRNAQRNATDSTVHMIHDVLLC